MVKTIKTITKPVATLALILCINVSFGQQAKSSTPPRNRFQEIMLLNRARHVARMTGERINGGVEQYRTEPAMHQAIGEKHVQNKGTYWLISFLGGTPEEVSIKKQYSIYTVIQIDKSNFQPKVIYNGEIPKDVKLKRELQ